MDHALIDEFLKRLILVDQADVEEEFIPEAGIDEVSCSMFGASEIEVNLLPVVACIAAYERFVVVVVHIAQVVR